MYEKVVLLKEGWYITCIKVTWKEWGRANGIALRIRKWLPSEWKSVKDYFYFMFLHLWGVYSNPNLSHRDLWIQIWLSKVLLWAFSKGCCYQVISIFLSLLKEAFFFFVSVLNSESEHIFLNDFFMPMTFKICSNYIYTSAYTHTQVYSAEVLKGNFFKSSIEFVEDYKIRIMMESIKLPNFFFFLLPNS